MRQRHDRRNSSLPVATPMFSARDALFKRICVAAQTAVVSTLSVSDDVNGKTTITRKEEWYGYCSG